MHPCSFEVEVEGCMHQNGFNKGGVGVGDGLPDIYFVLRGKQLGP